MSETLVKEIMGDLESGNRTSEQILRMRMGEFNNLHRPANPMFSTATMVSSMAMTWR